MGLIAGLAVALVGTGAVVAWNAGNHSRQAVAGAAVCQHRVRVVTAASFAPVLRQVAQRLARGAGCVAVTVTVADGQSAAGIVAATNADLWIPDDASWRNLPNPVHYAPGGGATIATSPIYLVTDGAELPPAALTWNGLATALAAQGSSRLVMRDGSTSGDGMVPGGALTYAVLETSGPLISASDLMKAWQAGTTIHDNSAALPRKPGDVGLVPEYALLRSGQAGKYTVSVTTDGTALMRFTWYPTVSGTADPDRAAALTRLRTALTDEHGVATLHASGLRAGTWSDAAPAAAPAAAVAAHLPPVVAPPMEVTVEHAMWHVLTTWDPAQRTANVLAVVDVSGSMGNPVPGTTTPLINLVRQGVGQITALLPGTSQLGLWRFGSQLAPPADYQQLVAPAPLTDEQRAKLTTATAGLAARRTGTGLYDTILAAYQYQQAHFQAGTANEILLFSDGVNQNDPNSISLAQLKAALAATDPAKRVQIGIFGFGRHLPTAALTDALAPVDGQVDTLTTADEVVAAFVHAVSGGLTH